MAQAGRVDAIFGANTTEFRAGVNQAQRLLASNGAKMNATMARMERGFARLGATAKTGILAFAAGFGLKEIASQFYEVNKEFQSLMAGLKTATGSQQAADEVFASLRQFAQETPYDLAQVVTAFIKLKNLGLDPSIRSLRAYGDVAAAMPGKTLDQFVEAVADAITGEFERLKEFGIKASTQGQQVTFTFRGMATTVRKNAADIEDYLRKLAEVNFGGAMAEKMNTIGGAASNLKDALDNLFVTIGKSGAAESLVDVLNALAAALNRLSGVTSPFAWGKDLEDTRARVIELRAQIAALGTVSPFESEKWRALGKLRDELERLQQLDAASMLESVQKQIAKLQSEGASSGQARKNRTARDEELDNLIARETELKAAIEARRKAEAGDGATQKKAATPTIDKSVEKKVSGVIEDMQLAYDNLSRSARDAYIATQLDKAGLKDSDTSAKAKSVRDLAAAYYDAKEAAESLKTIKDATSQATFEAALLESGYSDVSQRAATLAYNAGLLDENLKIKDGALESVRAYFQAMQHVADIQDKMKEQERSLERVEGWISNAADAWTVYQNRLAEINKLYEDGKLSVEKYQAAINAVTEDYEKNDALKQWAKDAEDQYKGLSNVAVGAFDDMADALADFATTGKFSFKSLVTSMIADLIRFEAKAALSGVANIASGFLSSIFGGGKADGGPVSGGTTYLVGERGPELFTPGTSGTIIPNGDLAAASAGGNTYVIDARGADAGAVSRIERALYSMAGPGRVEQRAINAVVDARQRNPKLFSR